MMNMTEFIEKLNLKISQHNDVIAYNQKVVGIHDYYNMATMICSDMHTNVDAGHGLLKVGSNLVPFENKFPKDTKLYKLMTSKFGEGYFAGSANAPSDEQEILNKIREVSMNNAEFDEMVKRYMDE